MNSDALLELYDRLEMIQKEASFRDAMRHGMTGLKTLGALGTGSYLAESTGRFLGGGDFHAPTTSKALSAGASALLNGTGIAPLLSSAGKSVADGMVNSDAVQAVTRNANDIIGKLNDGVSSVNELASNPAAVSNLTDAAGRAGNEFAKGYAGQVISDSAAKVYTDPQGLAGMLALSVVPPALFGLWHQKRRDQEAKVNRQILQALVSKKKEDRLSQKTAGLDWRRIRFGPAGASQWHKQQILKNLGKGQPMTPYAQRILQDMQKYKWYNPATWGIQQHPVYNSPWKSLLLVGGTGGAANVLRDDIDEATTPLAALGLQAKAIANGVRRGPLFFEEMGLDVRDRMAREGLFDDYSLQNTEGGRNVAQTIENAKTLGKNFSLVKEKLFPSSPVQAPTVTESLPTITESPLQPSDQVPPAVQTPTPSVKAGPSGVSKWLDGLSTNQKLGLGTAAFVGVPALAAYGLKRWIHRDENREKKRSAQLVDQLLQQ